MVTQLPHRPALAKQPEPSSLKEDQTRSAEQMAYQVADPTPFMPQGFHRQEVLGRKIMARVVTCRAAPTHEGWAILTIELPPFHEG
jgi:hypothetical protein